MGFELFFVGVGAFVAIYVAYVNWRIMKRRRQQDADEFLTLKTELPQILLDLDSRMKEIALRADIDELYSRDAGLHDRIASLTGAVNAVNEAYRQLGRDACRGAENDRARLSEFRDVHQQLLSARQELSSVETDLKLRAP